MSLTDTADIHARLVGRALSLVLELFPGGHREGNEYVCPKRAQGGPGDSLKIAVAGPEAGVWYHHAAGEGGSLIDLIAKFHTGGDIGQAFRWARRWLGLEPGERAVSTRRPQDEERNRAAVAADEAMEAQKREKAKKRAQAIWLGGSAETAASPVDWYLKGRGIDLKRLAAPPRALRFHPALDYPWKIYDKQPGARPPDARDQYPAMVAAIVLDSQHVATHRTYIDVIRPSEARKAALGAIADAKLSLGPVRGGLVRLANGEMEEIASGLIKPAPRLSEIPRFSERGTWGSIGLAFSRIYIAEGIENALTFACARPECRVAAAVSLPNLAHVRLPDFIAEVVLLRDNDGQNAAARQAFAKAFHWFRGHGKRVLEIAPPEGVKDINDYWQQERGDP